MNDLIKRVREFNRDLTIRKAIPADASEFFSLMSKRYTRKDNKDYFFWRFFSCPAPSVLYVIATKKNVVIGAYGVNILTLSNGKRCGLTVDLIISDQYTKRGLFFLLENKISAFAKRNNCTYLLSLSNTPGMQAYTKIDGWQILGTIPVLILKLGGAKPMQSYQTINNLNQKTISFKYNKSLLNWRFDKNPEYQYLHTQIGKCQSYIKIFFDNTKKISVGDIVFYTPSSKLNSEFSALIEASIQKLQTMNVQEVITWCNESSPLYPLFISLGFVPKDQPRYLCVKPLLPNTISPRLIKWQILPIDSEVF